MLAGRQPARPPDPSRRFRKTSSNSPKRWQSRNLQPQASRPSTASLTSFLPTLRPAEPQRAYDEPPPQPAPPAFERSIISANTSAAVDSAFNSLAQTVLVQNARTLEDLVREMLRPMLKSWLDDNLPSMVERIVRAEIERVSRGRQ